MIYKIYLKEKKINDMKSKWDAERFELNEKCKTFEIKYLNLSNFENERVTSLII